MPRAAKSKGRGLSETLIIAFSRQVPFMSEVEVSRTSFAVRYAAIVEKLHLSILTCFQLYLLLLLSDLLAQLVLGHQSSILGLGTL